MSPDVFLVAAAVVIAGLPHFLGVGIFLLSLLGEFHLLLLVLVVVAAADGLPVSMQHS